MLMYMLENAENYRYELVLFITFPAKDVELEKSNPALFV